jgi:hypothetical protein
MMFGPIRAVAIDDEPSHLLAITTGLSASGIPCMGYWYDRDTHSLKPEPDKNGLPFVRLVFMDLNLEELGGVPEAANLCGTVMDVLKQIISKDAGPYLIVFWTQIGSRVDAVKALLYERLEGIPCPITVVELPKGPFLVSQPKQQDFKAALGEFYSELHNNIGKLGEAVRAAVAQDSQLCALSSWESRASEAATRAVNEIFACASHDFKDPTKAPESIQKVLAKIAIAASGKKSATDSPARGLDAGMLDILVDQFGVSVEDPEYQEVVRKAIGETVKGTFVFQNELQMFAGLNTFFHIDTEVSTAKAWDRGVVIPAKPPLDANVLGFAAQDLITAEFLFPFELFPPERHADIQILLKEFRQSAQVVLVEIGADCDHAQDSDRTRRYLVGLEVPQRFSELTRYYENNKLRNESLQLLGPWDVNNEIFFLLVSCRRFWAWQKKTPPAATVKYRLRASLVNKLLHHYSVWSSRPGIVEFR